ncbi:MAG: hypothetical protein R2773_04270 [Flavobacteriaceae bacterium]
MKTKLGLRLLAFLITVGLLYLLQEGILALLQNDFSASLVPGWHTTMYPVSLVQWMGTAFFALVTLLGYHLALKLLQKIQM